MLRSGVGFLILVCGGAALFAFSWLRPDSPSPVFDRVDPPGLVEIAPGFDYVSWYGEESGFEPTSEHFGAYVIQPMGDRLILGFGGGLPANDDGALLASFDGNNLQTLGVVHEQGTRTAICMSCCKTAISVVHAT